MMSGCEAYWKQASFGSHIFNLNDPSELSHGLSHAVKILNSKAAKGPPESKLFTEDLAAFLQQGGIQKSGHYFMCSFSSCGDDLGQWRAYADNGRGYAIGFDAHALEDKFAEQATAPILKVFPITYKDVELILPPKTHTYRMRGRKLSRQAADQRRPR